MEEGKRNYSSNVEKANGDSGRLQIERARMNSMLSLKADSSPDISRILIYLTVLISFTTLYRSLAIERIWSSQWENPLTVRVTHGD